MANTALTKAGYAQVEPNRLTAQKTREVYAQQKKIRKLG